MLKSTIIYYFRQMDGSNSEQLPFEPQEIPIDLDRLSLNQKLAIAKKLAASSGRAIAVLTGRSERSLTVEAEFDDRLVRESDLTETHLTPYRSTAMLVMPDGSINQVRADRLELLGAVLIEDIIKLYLTPGLAKAASKVRDVLRSNLYGSEAIAARVTLFLSKFTGITKD